ncbi:MAG TPA: hypothetical protein VF790_11735, partial [Dissulfurispiraceae bacterium]
MQTSELTIRIILLILPGAIATLIIEKLTVHKPWDAFRFIFYSTLMGFVTYLTYQVYYFFVVSAETLSFWKAITDSRVSLSIKEILCAAFTAIPLGFVISAAIQYKIINKTANRLKVSNKYGDDNLFYHFLNFNEVQWLWVRDKDQDVTYEGFLQFYNETDSLREIVLSEVKVFRSSDSEFIREAPYIYLTFSPD